MDQDDILVEDAMIDPSAVVVTTNVKEGQQEQQEGGQQQQQQQQQDDEEEHGDEDEQQDRNFNDLKDLFHERIYGTVKGQYRISMTIQDIESQLSATTMEQEDEQGGEQQQEQRQKDGDRRLLTALDIGGGLGQMTLHLAKSGKFRQVDYFDISHEMKAHVDMQVAMAKEKGELQVLKQQQSQEQHYEDENEDEEVRVITHLGGLKDAIAVTSSSCCSSISNTMNRGDLLTADVVCLHAVLEWLANPMDDLEALLNYMKTGSMLSLLYYNKLQNTVSSTPSEQDPDTNTQRPKENLLNLKKKSRKPSPLTPYHEFTHDEIEDKLAECGFEITIRTGLRVKKFHPRRRRRRNNRYKSDADADENIDADLLKYLEEEQAIARIEPYYWQGRYNHVIAIKKQSRRRETSR